MLRCRYTIICLLLLAILFCNAMNELITLPTEKKLCKRLRNAGFAYFVDKTHIDAELANRQMYPIGVVLVVEKYVADYEKIYTKIVEEELKLDGKLTSFLTILSTKPTKSTVIPIILKDHPEVIQELRTMEILPRVQDNRVFALIDSASNNILK